MSDNPSVLVLGVFHFRYADEEGFNVYKKS
ncbi:hypothetical protein J2T15_000158 [Paenibacillus harenae]|uniref:Uncharacterized protein n=1 Tax=Paenibacillus harenae TaxID=306543 RepID=A0ABT9TUK2_PAEHA|nr:hypothetical protein [Paenibacillus harenae]